MENEKPKLDIEKFERFVSLYTARYSERKMNDETASLFYDKCCEIPTDEFQHVTDLMIGKRDKPFSYFQILEAHSSIFNNKDNLTMEQIREWKKVALAGNQNHRKLLAQLMNEIITKVGHGHIKEDWRKDYAKKFVAVVGEKEARIQVSGLKEFDPVFGNAVLDLLPVRSSF